MLRDPNKGQKNVLQQNAIYLLQNIFYLCPFA